MGTFRLQHLSWLAGWTAVLGCMMLGGVLFVVSLSDYRRYSLGIAEFERYRLALLAANAISAERAPANSLMGASEEKVAEFQKQLQEHRAFVGRALDALQASFATDRARFDMELAALTQLREDLAAGREAVDEMTALPPIEHRGRGIATAIGKMFHAADTAFDMTDHLGETIVSNHSQISTEIVMANACARLREHAGRFGSYVVMLLTAEKADDAELSLLLANTAGRIDALRELIASYGAAFLADKTVAQSLREMDQAYFGAALPYAWGVALKALKEPGLMTAGEFTFNYVPGMQPVERLRDLIIERLSAHIVAARDNAGLLLGIAAALTLLVTALLMVISLALRRLLFRPLLSAKDQIVQIAQDDLDEPPLPHSFSREIREMFDGLQTLRESQRKRRALETERDRLTDRLKTLSETDGLTGLLNRRAIDTIGIQAITEAARTGESVAFLMFDVDHFKAVNDTYGHGVGDLVLQRVAETIRAEVRSSDVVARFGGEEFAVLARSITSDGGRQLADKLRLAIAAMVVAPEHDMLRITASFGVAMWQPGAESWAELVERADRQLYRAKNLGRNCVCMQDGIDAPAEAVTPRRKTI